MPRVTSWESLKRFNTLTFAFALLCAAVHAGAKSGTIAGLSTGGGCSGELAGYKPGTGGSEDGERVDCGWDKGVDGDDNGDAPGYIDGKEDGSAAEVCTAAARRTRTVKAHMDVPLRRTEKGRDGTGENCGREGLL